MDTKYKHCVSYHVYQTQIPCIINDTRHKYRKIINCDQSISLQATSGANAACMFTTLGSMIQYEFKNNFFF